MKRVLGITLVFGMGVIAGAVAMNLFEMHVRPTYREVMRAEFVGEQELSASRDARAGDQLRAVLHFWNVVDAPAFQIFRTDRAEDANFWLPWQLLVLGWMRGGPDQARARQMSEALQRARLALALESIQQHESATEQWDMAARIGKRSKDATRRSAETLAREENSDLHRQAEAGILDGTGAPEHKR